MHGVLALVLIVLVATALPVQIRHPLALLTLPALALLAEYLPVNLGRHGLRLTFTLPFVVGMAVAGGPLAAVITDVIVTLLASIFHGSKGLKRGSGFWIWMNVSVAAISASIGGLCFGIMSELTFDVIGRTTYSSLAFAVSYGALNLLLVTNLGRFFGHQHRAEDRRHVIRVGSQGAILYSLMAVVVSVLVHRGLFYLAPLTLVPIWALRTGILLQGRMEDHYTETISALSLMLQRAHPYTHAHLERVAKLAGESALSLGLSPARARLVREASVLHDIGKIAIDEQILDKPCKLTEVEYEHVKHHSVFGSAILASVQVFGEMVPWIRHHHERVDGKGYPDGLRGEEIPIESRIIAVADAYDAMTGTDPGVGSRNYRQPMTTEAAIAELERCSGTQFDPRVVRVFKEVLASGGM